MKTLATLLFAVMGLIAYSQPCTLNTKIKLVKQKPCLPCTEIYATTNKAGVFTYLWSNGSTNDTIQVCDTTSQIYSVTVTDTSGCFDVDSIKTKNTNCQPMCHQRGSNRKITWGDICVNFNAVPAHLAHGDSLGCCKIDQPTRVIRVHSNNGNHNGHRKMTVEFASFEVEKTVITLTNIEGKQVTIYEGLTDGETLDIKVPVGVYILSMQTSGETITTKVVVLE